MSEVSQNFLPMVEVFFPKAGMFRNLRDISTKNTPKTTFYSIFINKFPQKCQKSAQKVFAVPSAPQKTNITSIRSKISAIISIIQTNNAEKSKILLVAESWSNENELE